MNDPHWIPKGFLLAAAVNVFGILLFSQGLTNAYLRELDPQVFSIFGLLCILLWGLAYVATAKIYRQAKWLVAVFAVEKLVYFSAWVLWMSRYGSELPIIFEMSPLTWAFYVIYGPNDLIFAIFFGWVFFKVHRG